MEASRRTMLGDDHSPGGASSVRTSVVTSVINSTGIPGHCEQRRALRVGQRTAQLEHYVQAHGSSPCSACSRTRTVLHLVPSVADQTILTRTDNRE
jgi:hypothetical protein